MLLPSGSKYLNLSAALWQRPPDWSPCLCCFLHHPSTRQLSGRQVEVCDTRNLIVWISLSLSYAQTSSGAPLSQSESQAEVLIMVHSLNWSSPPERSRAHTHSAFPSVPLHSSYLRCSLNPPDMLVSFTRLFQLLFPLSWRFPGGSVVKNPPANARKVEDAGWSLGQKDYLEDKMATHSSGKSHRLRSLAGYSLQSVKELDMSEPWRLFL